MNKKFQILGLILCMTIFAQSQMTIYDSLVFYYPCDSNLLDNSGNNIHGQFTGNYTSDPNGIANHAIDLNGLSDSIKIPYSPLLKVGLPATYMISFKVDSFPSTYSTAIFHTEQHNILYYGFWVGVGWNQKISINYGDGGGIGSSSRRSKQLTNTIQTGIWYKLIAVWRGPTDMDIYLDCNNMPADYSGNGGSLIYSGSPLDGSIGVGQFNPVTPSYFNGKLDEIAFWKRALTVNEISRLCEGDLVSAGEEIKENLKVEVYPNPTKDYFEVSISGTANIPEYSIVLYDIFGKVVLKQDMTAGSDIIDVSHLKSGMYFYHVSHQHQLLSSGKIIKE